MANEFVKAEQVLGGMLGVLERDTILAQFVWRDIPDSAFRGVKNDTVTLRIPAYTSARTRVMRSSTAITLDDLTETSVDVKLDTHVYKAIRVTDEEMTLDIADFSAQVSGPASNAVVRKIDDSIAAQMDASAPATWVDLDEADPYLGVLQARIALNNANVPMDGRFLAVGSNVELALLSSDRLLRWDSTGSSEALREAVIGRIAGFTAISVPGLNPDIAIAAHRTAFPLATVVPVVPAGASWGTTSTWRGFGLRAIRDYAPTDTNGPADRFLTDCFIGVGTTLDNGTVDIDGKFTPSEDGNDDDLLVRAVKLTLGAS